MTAYTPSPLELVPEDPNQQNELARDMAISRLAPGLAHEVANPLSAICGFAQVMLTEPNRTDDDREALGHILASAKRCLRLMDAYQRLSRKAAPRKTATVDLGACVEDSVLLLKGNWRLKPALNVRVVHGPGIAHAAAPVTPVVHAVVQLLEGSVELLGGAESKLDITVMPRGGGALLSIDGKNGIEMTPELVPDGLRVAKAVLGRFGGIVEWCAAGGQMHVEAWIPSE
jgi:nitrogen-specific signal transduction histidine kinase